MENVTQTGVTQAFFEECLEQQDEVRWERLKIITVRTPNFAAVFPSLTLSCCFAPDG